MTTVAPTNDFVYHVELDGADRQVWDCIQLSGVESGNDTMDAMQAEHLDLALADVCISARVLC